MVIDFHTHAFSDKIAESAISTLSKRCGIVNHHDGTVSGLLESMRRSGVDISVIMPIATKPAQTTVINDWAAEVNKLDRIISFGTVHPDFKGWKDELYRIKALGLKGVKFHPDYQRFYVDETRMLPIYAKALELDLILMFHSGVDIGLPPPTRCTPRRISNIINLFRGQKVIFAHMGAFQMYQNAEEFVLGEDVFIETSMALSDINPTRLLRMFEKNGFDKILFGSDSPWSNPARDIAYLKSLGIPKEDLDKILWKNAVRLLGLNL